MKKLIYCILGLLVSAACTETLYDDETPPAADEGNGIQFCVTTLEQADMTIGIGQTRAAASDTLWQAYRQADRFVAHQLEGDNPCGLNVQRMPLPYVGIHPGTVNTQRAQDAMTRAPLSEIVKADGTNFHDSLTIWGCVFDPDNHDNATNHYFLFSQTLLKRIRNWRSSVQWPYEDGKYMRFCAVSPAFESMNMTLASQPQYDNGTLIPPTFNYTLPEKAAEMRDVLFGTSDPVIIDVQSIGSKTDNLGKDNKTVNLTFQHALTAIRFAQGKIPAGITIKKISLNHVYTKGTFNPAAVDPATGTNGAWSNISTTGNYELNDLSDYAEGENTYIDGQQVMFMIPHTVTEDAKLEVVIEAIPKYTYTETGRTEYTGDDSQEHTLKCSLTGDVWKKGYTVTYKLTIGEVEDGYYLVAESPAAHEHSDSPITGTFPVHSYHSYWDYNAGSENKTHAVNWKVAAFSLDGENFEDITSFNSSGKPENSNWPTWLSVTGTNSGTSNVYTGGDGSLANYTISGQSYTKSGKHSEILGRNSVTLASDKDLSEEKGTANCYIVNKQGSYKFPLVYGNKSADGAESLCFVDHLGTTISFKDIENQIKAHNPDDYEPIDETHRKRATYTWYAVSGGSQTIRSAIVWQDVSGLITSPTITTEAIGFTVSQSKPGNAVLALQGRKETIYQKKDGVTWVLDTSQGTNGYEYSEWETFWTWHIWMTDEVYPNAGTVNGVSDNQQFLNYNAGGDHIVSIQNYDGSTNTILPVNLGWVPDKDEFGYYSHREVWVKLEQTEKKDGGTAATTVVKIEQHARQPLITGTSTIYQWGRPTALPMVATSSNVKRTIYDGSGNDITDQFAIATVAAPGDAITKTTSILRYNDYDDGNSTWFDYTENTPQYWSTTKTVYDPCPPGFYVPQVSIFTGLSRTGGDSENGTGLNMYQTVTDDIGTHTDGSTSAGGYFYTTKYTDDATLKANRYTYEQVYFPVTKEWQGDVDAGTSMFDAKTNNGFGFYWCSDWANEKNKKDVLLWIAPSWTYEGSSDKPAIQFGRNLKYSSAQPIRPTGNLLAY